MDRSEGNCGLSDVHFRDDPVSPLHVMIVCEGELITAGLDKGWYGERWSMTSEPARERKDKNKMNRRNHKKNKKIHVKFPPSHF